LLNENEIQIARDHIASYLNKNDLVNFATINSEYNNILSKRLAYEKEKYNYDKYLKHNIMVTIMYNKDRERHYLRRQYYKCCLICGREIGHPYMSDSIVFCFICQYRVSENIKKKLESYYFNTCDCIMREVRMMILNNVDETKINEMFTLETRFNFNHDEGGQCLENLYSFYAPKVIRVDEHDYDEDEYEYDEDDEDDEE
jgi:hypothetical protein